MMDSATGSDLVDEGFHLACELYLCPWNRMECKPAFPKRVIARMGEGMLLADEGFRHHSL